jgi:tagatose-1,6-bisphosphate aldolase non-catalytic subunit AgaZ/GatZ
LSQSVLHMPDLVFEAHSTDYQTQHCLSDLVHSHFAILKVGPELTFAYREALFAMEAMEAWIDVSQRSELQKTIASVMDEDPRYWRDYVARNQQENTTRLFGLSDRIRYYWPNSRIDLAVKVLRNNIDKANVSTGLLSQYTGRLSDNSSAPLSERIIKHKVGCVVAKYRVACVQSQ